MGATSRPRPGTFVIVLLAAAGVLYLPEAASPAGLFLRPFPDPVPTASLRLSQPQMHDLDLEVPSGAWDFRLAKPVATRLNFQLEFALTAVKSYEIESGHRLELGRIGDTIANVGLGMQAIGGRAGRRSCATVVLGLPAVETGRDGGVHSVGRASNPYDLFRSADGRFGVGLTLAHERVKEDHLAWQVEIGTQVLIPHRAAESSSQAVHFGTGLEARAKAVALRVEYFDLLDLAGSSDRLGDHLAQSVAAGLRLRGSRVRPAVFVSIPIDARSRETVAQVVGLEAEVDLTRPRPAD